MALEYAGHGRSDGLLVSVPSWSSLISDVSAYMFETSSFAIRSVAFSEFLVFDYCSFPLLTFSSIRKVS